MSEKTPQHIRGEGRRIARARRAIRWDFWTADPHCWYCGRLLLWRDSTLDHFIPQVHGGDDSPANLRLACGLCNRLKNAALPHWLVCRLTPGLPVLQLIDFYLRRPAKMNTEPIGFNYDLLKVKVRQATQRHAKAIHDLVRQTTAGVVEIGRRLHEVRASMDNRTWEAWLRAEFRWGKSTASNFMQVTHKFGHLDCLDNFQHSALYVLVRKNVDERAVTAAVKEAEEGKTITHKRAVELVTEYAPANSPTPSAPKPQAIHGLRHAIRELSSNVDALLKSCTSDELNGMADELLQLAVQLRQAVTKEPSAATAQKTRQRRRKTETTAA